LLDWIRERYDIAFFLTKNNLNIELIDTEEREGWKDEEGMGELRDGAQ
jgi:hypothetical protein